MQNIYIRISLLIFAALWLGGCNTISYYGQAINGQYQILAQRQPISQLIEDPATNEKLKQRLQMVVRMRTFASTELGLPDNDSYKSYVDLERSHVVWNVFAAPEFSLIPKQWCYPVAGCVSYRGYFSKKNALAYATKLQLEDFDTEVSGITAYSTLGWFNDPLLNTMLSRSDIQLAGTLFHELAHQQLYAKDDTQFNESFAVVVELEGVRRWLLDQKNSAQYRNYLQLIKRKREFINLVQDARAKLKILYSSDSTAVEKQTAKQAIFQQLKTDYRQLRKSWNNYRGYDTWFDRKLTNASLVPISSYYDYVPAFQVLLQHNQNNLEAFYLAARKLAEKTPADRKEALNQLAADQTPETPDRG